ncbi:MAG: MBL fold metallo-hydrolase [Candidatus Thorarchaeota archaeon]|jgi:L-ascorbate metabolism protein UlaG (beta-lactamase superfamily)
MTEIPRIIYLGQSGFYIETTDSKLLIDPPNKKAGDLEGDLVYSTHKHFDHTGGVETFLTRNPDAILVGNEQVTGKFSQFGDRVKTVRDKELFEFKSHSLYFTRLKHGIWKGIINLAVEIHIGDFTFAHCGDAVSFEGFPSSGVDVLAIPISGAFAASPKKALEMISNLKEPLPTIVPMHWLIRSPESFCRKLHEVKSDVSCIVPSKEEPLNGYE